MITLTTTGNLSEHFWGSGELITQWSIELNTTANSATPDATGLQIAVAHTGGVYIVNTELKIVTSEQYINSVDAVAWFRGDLWFGFYGGERRAKGLTHSKTGETTEATIMQWQRWQLFLKINRHRWARQLSQDFLARRCIAEQPLRFLILSYQDYQRR